MEIIIGLVAIAVVAYFVFRKPKSTVVVEEAVPYKVETPVAEVKVEEKKPTVKKATTRKAKAPAAKKPAAKKPAKKTVVRKSKKA